MKKYLKQLVIALCAFTLIGTAAFAADSSTAVPVTTAKQTSLFNANEVGVSLATSYAVDRSRLFEDAYTLNINAGAFWFPTRNLGFEVNVPFYQTSGPSVDEVQAGVLFRLPLARTTFLLSSLAPYVGVDAVYNWETPQAWAYIGKVGLEVRLNPKWSIFAEGQFRNNQLSNWNNGQTSVNGGLKLVF